MTTPWTDFLHQQGATIHNENIFFDSIQTASADTTAVPLIHLGLIRSTGIDSAAFLHPLFSNDVTHLAPDAVQWNSFNTPKGRMLANFLLWHSAEGHTFTVSRDILPALQKKLSMYILRSKVKLSCADPETALIGVCGADTPHVLTQAGLPILSSMQQQQTGDITQIQITDQLVILAVPATHAPEHYTRLIKAGATRGGTASWQKAMIQAGLPLVTAATQEEFVAQMLNFDLIGGVNFKKGCYPGQEIVARTQYLGKLKKRLYRISGQADTAPAAGSDLYASGFGDQSAGKIVNSTLTDHNRFEALAVIQRSSAAGDTLHLASPEGPQVTLLELPYPLPSED